MASQVVERVYSVAKDKIRFVLVRLLTGVCFEYRSSNCPFDPFVLGVVQRYLVILCVVVVVVLIMK